MSDKTCPKCGADILQPCRQQHWVGGNDCLEAQLSTATARIAELEAIVGKLKIIDCEDGLWKCRWCGQMACKKEIIKHITGCPVKEAAAAEAGEAKP